VTLGRTHGDAAYARRQIDKITQSLTSATRPWNLDKVHVIFLPPDICWPLRTESYFIGFSMGQLREG
jgi:hypothetical protein